MSKILRYYIVKPKKGISRKEAKILEDFLNWKKHEEIKAWKRLSRKPSKNMLKKYFKVWHGHEKRG